MRGAWESYFEYIPELHTEGIFIQIGCDGLAHVIEAGVLSDTHGDRQCELLMNKGGNTKRYAEIWQVRSRPWMNKG